jgi:hypothetical protein
MPLSAASKRTTYVIGHAREQLPTWRAVDQIHDRTTQLALSPEPLLRSDTTQPDGLDEPTSVPNLGQRYESPFGNCEICGRATSPRRVHIL